MIVSDVKSPSSILSCGVPQGPVLGPELLSDYISPIGSIIHSYGVSFHEYADDTQLYASFLPGDDELDTLANLEHCITHVKAWMHQNRLKLIDSKTDFFLYLALLTC